MPVNANQLIDHLDSSRQGTASPDTQRLIDEDPETAQEWQYLNLAISAVQDAALNDRVGSVRAAWKVQQSENDIRPPRATIRTMYRSVLRVAACILILAGGAAALKYYTTSSSNLYRKYYASYQLNASRGAAADAMEKAYNDRNWQEVLKIYDAGSKKDNKMYFLAGMADLELKKYDEAVGRFEQVLAANLQSGSDYFQDEAEYYLAMSCLARNDVNEAIPLLEKIKSNKDHLYHATVEKMSSLDLRIAQYRNSK